VHRPAPLEGGAISERNAETDQLRRSNDHMLAGSRSARIYNLAARGSASGVKRRTTLTACDTTMCDPSTDRILRGSHGTGL